MWQIGRVFQLKHRYQQLKPVQKMNGGESNVDGNGGDDGGGGDDDDDDGGGDDDVDGGGDDGGDDDDSDDDVGDDDTDDGDDACNHTMVIMRMTYLRIM